MARIAGVNIPQNKLVHVGLTYIYGIGDRFSNEICKALSIPKSKRVNELTDDSNFKNTWIYWSKVYSWRWFKTWNSLSIKRLIDLATYRGSRHRKKLPARGQRTRCNARTRKGKAIAIAGKKLTPLKNSMKKEATDKKENLNDKEKNKKVRIQKKKSKKNIPMV